MISSRVRPRFGLRFLPRPVRGMGALLACSPTCMSPGKPHCSLYLDKRFHCIDLPVTCNRRCEATLAVATLHPATAHNPHSTVPGSSRRPGTGVAAGLRNVSVCTAEGWARKRGIRAFGKRKQTGQTGLRQSLSVFSTERPSDCRCRKGRTLASAARVSRRMTGSWRETDCAPTASVCCEGGRRRIGIGLAFPPPSKA